MERYLPEVHIYSFEPPTGVSELCERYSAWYVINILMPTLKFCICLVTMANGVLLVQSAMFLFLPQLN